MAMIDYGVLVKIDGRIVNKNQFFMDMEQSVGWVDYPKIRYSDCDCIDDDGRSFCSDCPRRKTEHCSHIDLGEWDRTIGDCRGNEITIVDKLDGNYFAFTGDEDFTVAIYKTFVVFTSKDKSINTKIWCGNGFYIDGIDEEHKIVKKINMVVQNKTIPIKIKRVTESDSQFYMTFKYKNKNYEVVFGYGVDSDKKVWDKVKTRYCAKKVVKFIDKFWQEKNI